MKILLLDIVRTSLEDVWPSVEHALGLQYISASLKQRFGDEVEIRLDTIVSRTGFPRDERDQVRRLLE